MSPRKLTDANKEEILELYRTTEETTSTLAKRYGVSSSTISRFLKTNLSEYEYENLIQQKRLARTPHRGRQKDESPPPLQLDWSDLEAKEEKPVLKKSPEAIIPQREPQLLEDEEDEDENEEDAERVEVITLKEILGEDLADLDEDEEDLVDLEDDEWEENEEPSFTPSPLPRHKNVTVLPLSEASFPKTCYLVIDKTAELITRPLKEFADLGKIPATEVQEKTLPIFDNQKVARRFSNRSQRIIKVPDSNIFKKTSSYLQAKGITRLLIDGQVYAL